MSINFDQVNKFSRDPIKKSKIVYSQLRIKADLFRQYDIETIYCNVHILTDGKLNSHK